MRFNYENINCRLAYITSCYFSAFKFTGINSSVAIQYCGFRTSILVIIKKPIEKYYRDDGLYFIEFVGLPTQSHLDLMDRNYYQNLIDAKLKFTYEQDINFI
jgi:hypothetical protein